VSQSAVPANAGGEPVGPVKVMTLRYAGKCGCGQQLSAGSRAGWNSSTRSVVCESCLTPTNPPELRPVQPEPRLPVGVDIGRPGASLVRQYDKRVAQRDARVRREHPRIGGLILALTDEPQSTDAFASGAVGEQKAAKRLMGACGSSVLFLHNRRLGRGRQGGDVDMIAITSLGIHVIDVKRYVDKAVEIRRSGGFFSPVTEQLFIGGRDKTKLLESLSRQVEAVRAALADYPDGTALPITPSLCFVDADLPLIRNRHIRGIPVLGLPGTTRLLVRSTGPLTAEQRDRIHSHLADRMPAA
jgi:Nuclease-related domain